MFVHIFIYSIMFLSGSLYFNCGIELVSDLTQSPLQENFYLYKANIVLSYKIICHVIKDCNILIPLLRSTRARVGYNTLTRQYFFVEGNFSPNEGFIMREKLESIRFWYGKAKGSFSEAKSNEKILLDNNVEFTENLDIPAGMATIRGCNPIPYILDISLD
jgi:hypothetical protein